MADVAVDFSLLAQDDRRAVKLPPLPRSSVMADPKYARQIIHNFFSNALKHGRSDIRVKLAGKNGTCVLTIANWLRAKPAAQLETLGLGLRVVDTLLSLQPDIRCRRRRGSKCFVVRLSFPVSAHTDVEHAGVNSTART